MSFSPDAFEDLSVEDFEAGVAAAQRHTTEMGLGQASLSDVSADSLEATGAGTPADALGVTKRMSSLERETQERDDTECPTCGDEFATIGDMKIHHHHKHGESLPSGVETKCDYCEDRYRTTRSKLKKYDHTFCSTECKNTWLATIDGEDHPLAEADAVVECETCGEEVARPKSWVEGRESHFCSTECHGIYRSENQSGDKHPNWKGGNIDYYGPSWAKQRSKALDRDDAECVICGKEPVDVHHIRPFREFGVENHEEANRLGNLVCLCRSHHSKWEGIPLRPEVLRDE